MTCPNCSAWEHLVRDLERETTSLRVQVEHLTRHAETLLSAGDALASHEYLDPSFRGRWTRAKNAYRRAHPLPPEKP